MCGTYDSLAVAPAPNCTCREDVVPPVTFVGVADQNACNIACADHCNLSEPLPCIKGGSFPDPKTDETESWCSCVDGNTHVVLTAAAVAAGEKCNEVCSDPDLTDDGKYHGLKLVLKITTANRIISGDDGGNFTIKVNEPGYYDFSGSYDCKDEIIHFAINFSGTPTFPSPDEVCCMQSDKPGCPVSPWSWGSACDLAIGTPPFCKTDSYYPDSSDYPIYKHAYTDSGLSILWIGSSVDLGSCYDVEKYFRIDVK